MRRLRAVPSSHPARTGNRLRFMLINLLPDFFAVLQSADPSAAYHGYFETHRTLLEAYWHNYVIEPAGPHFQEVVRDTVRADRSNLRAMLERIDVLALARGAEEQCARLFEVDSNIDVVLMVGVGAANAGEMVVGGRGVAFVCLEHFTSVADSSTRGLGLDPELIPMWLAHEIAHCVRYTSPRSRSEMHQLVAEAGDYYSYWETGRGATLREHLVNEGLAVQASRQVSAGHAPWEYFGYARKQYARIRELEAVLSRAVADDLDRTGLGLRLRYLSGGMSDESRTVQRYILPERAGYFLGARMVEDAIAERGLPWALRASAREIASLSDTAARTA
ncbi:MAG: DUF2268 domain-containing putative Zn-dependent protease [Gemmatimonadaceae bacterium]